MEVVFLIHLKNYLWSIYRDYYRWFLAVLPIIFIEITCLNLVMGQLMGLVVGNPYTYFQRGRKSIHIDINALATLVVEKSPIGKSS